MEKKNPLEKNRKIEKISKVVVKKEEENKSEEFIHIENSDLLINSENSKISKNEKISKIPNLVKNDILLYIVKILKNDLEKKNFKISNFFEEILKSEISENFEEKLKKFSINLPILFLDQKIAINKEKKEIENLLQKINSLIEFENSENSENFKNFENFEKKKNFENFENLKKNLKNLFFDKTKKIKIKIKNLSEARFFNDEIIEFQFKKDEENLKKMKNEIINLLNFENEKKLKNENFQKFKENILKINLFSFSEGKFSLIEIYNGLFFFQKQIKNFENEKKKILKILKKKKNLIF